MQGLTVFPTLSEAIHAGFQVYDRTATGYLVRRHETGGWALAMVEPRECARKL